MNCCFQVNSQAKVFRRDCCIVLFHHVQQQITNKMEKDNQQAIIGIKREHQLAITNNDSMIQAIQHDQVSLQGGIKNERQIVTDLIDN